MADRAFITSASILCGRAFALTAAVTMDGNTISNDCANGGDLGSGRTDIGSAGFSALASSAGATDVPEPAALPLLAAAILAAAAFRRRAPAATAPA